MTSGTKGTRGAGRIARILALAMAAGGVAAHAQATQIILTATDSYPVNQGSEVEYNSLVGMTKTQTAAGDTLQLSTPGMPAGLTTAGLTLSNTQGNLAVAAASLDQGIVRAVANGGAGLTGIISRNTFANAVMHDGVTFHISDDATDALVGVHVHLDGIESGAGLGNGGYNADLVFSLGGSFEYVSSIVNNGNQGYTFNGNGGFPPSGWESYAISNDSLTGFDFDGVIKVTNGQLDPFSMGLGLNCYDNTVCDFSHTGQVTLTLPTDVTFTSDSGVFLTADQTVSGGAPEPATWAMMLVRPARGPGAPSSMRRGGRRGGAGLEPD